MYFYCTPVTGVQWEDVMEAPELPSLPSVVRLPRVVWATPPGDRKLIPFLESPSHALQARGSGYHWEGNGPLSIKMFLGGAARYQAGGGSFAVGDDRYLVLNHAQRYSITIESPTPVESFCLFFRAGLAEEVRRSLRERPEALLDKPEDPGQDDTPICFYERTYPHDDTLSPALFALRATLLQEPEGNAIPYGWLDEQMRLILERLLQRHHDIRAEVDAFGAAASIARAATRDELYRRLHHARDYMAAAYDQPLTLDEVGRVACLSPNHLLRTFRALFGQTPHQYLTEQRLAVARRLLLTTDIPVTTICLEVGFISPGSFSRLFACRFGSPPDRYRRVAP